jgi:hypothetical protein
MEASGEVGQLVEALREAQPCRAAMREQRAGTVTQRLPSAPLSVSDRSVAVTERSQRGDRQTFASVFPVDTFSAPRCLGV